MGYFGMMGTMVVNAQQLKELHYHIEDRRIPVTLKDDLAAQIKEIERYLGRTDFSTANRKRQTVNILGGVMALPLLAYPLLLVLNRFLGHLGMDIHLEQINRTLMAMMIAYWPALVLYSALVIALVGCYYWLSHLTVKAIEHVIQQFMLRTRGHY